MRQRNKTLYIVLFIVAILLFVCANICVDVSAKKVYAEEDSVETTAVVPGDMNGDAMVDINDAIYLLRHTMMPTRYPVAQSADVNGTENVDINDAIYLLRHTMMSTKYPIVYVIKYYNIDEAENTNPKTYTSSEEINLTSPIKLGYNFLGWYSDADFTNEVTTIDIGTTGTVELYAKWEAMEYTITYENAKGATNSNATTYTIESETITLSDISVAGYTFDGWYQGEEKVTEITAGSYGDITLTAKGTAIEYTISYENTKGAENSNEVTYTIESETITLSDISVAGYTFDGWYQGEEKVTEITAGSYGDITLTAKWTAIEYTITYMYDENIGGYADGTSNPATYTVEDEFTFTLLVNHTEGYISLGWYTAKNNGDGEKVDGISLGSMGNLTVYAHWGLEVYSITYYNTDGVTNTNATTYTIESETFTIADVSKVGYLFDGWYSDEELTQSANLTVTQGSHGDIAFYAKWTAIEYTVSYALYGGSYEGTGNPETYTIESSFTLVSPVLSGYVFGGWYTASESGSKVTAIAAGTTGNLTFYARWIHISTITFNSLGGSEVNGITVAAGSAISAPVAPEKDYYTFAGWYTDAACTNAYAFTVMPEEDITLYARWTAIEYSITYILNGGTNASGNPVIYTVEDGITLSEATKTGYTFIGWFTDETFMSAVVTEIAVGTHGNITLYANYSVNRYTITFESNGGTSVSSITQNYATEVTAPDAPAKNGYLFVGWYTDSTLRTAYTFSTMPAYDFTLYAKWSLVTYQIAYHLDGGTNASGNPSSYTIEKATITLASPQKTGYTFEGWYSDSAYTTAVTQIASGSYGDIELFAKWNVITYTVTYVLADGAANGNITSYTIETDITTLEDALLSGYTFNGWYSDADYTQKITTVAGGEIGNLTLYGKFTANIYTVWLDGTEETSYTVTFDLNGASGSAPATQNITETNTLVYPAIPARDGYLFGGWYTNAECTGDLYDFTASLTKDVTLYAKWIECGSSAATSVGATATVELQGQTELSYTFVPLVTGNVTITTVGNYDTYGELYNASGVMLARDDDSGTDDNFLIVYNVTAGKAYTVMLRGFSSSVTGSVTLSIAGNTAVADGAKAQISTKTTATYGDSFTLTVPAARDGYKFLGWADENGALYTDANGASINVWDKAENTVLYSVWEKMVYTVTFVTNGGSEVESVSLAFGERLDLNEYITQRSGYTFGGWYLSASDSEAYEATTMPDYNITLYAKWITFALGSIKYDTDKTAISVYDTIDETLFNAICIDTDGNLATFTVTVNGTQAAGETITVRLTATSGGKTKQVTLTDIKVYGDPTLTVTDSTKDYINPDEFTASAWGASGTDTFGAATEITVSVDGEYKAGDTVTVIISSKDVSGNTVTQEIENVKVYGNPVITYDIDKTAISINDTLSAELFGATAVDSFGENVAVVVSKYSGTLAAGNTVTILLKATDSKGNITEIYVSVQVYGAPTFTAATQTEFTVNDSVTAESLGITAKDTYGNALDITLTQTEGTWAAGGTVVYTASVTDVAGNTAALDISVTVYGTPTITVGRTSIKVTEDPTAIVTLATVSFNLNGGSGSIASQTVTATSGLVYPEIPTRSGYVFRGWFTSSDCTTVYDFTAKVTGDITLYAGWQAMVTTTYYSRNIIDITSSYNSSGSAYSFSNSGTSSSAYRYTYFTAYRSGTYRIYYKNSSSSSSYGTYCYIYNATTGTAIKSNANVYSTSYSYVSVTANAGDVIYIRNYRYSTSYSATFYLYVTGGSLPYAGGNTENYLNVSAKDSFGNELTVSVTLKSGSLTGGTTAVYTLTATDRLGNTASKDVTVKIYDQADIKLTYYNMASDLIKLTSRGEEFSAQATDSFGDACTISIEAAKGFTLKAGNTISLYIVATDIMGNKAYSELITGIKVYDTPTIIYNGEKVGSDYVIYNDTDIDFLFTVYDSFGEELYATISVSGTQTEGEVLYVTVTATDDAGNTVKELYNLIVSPTGHTYSLNSDGVSYSLTAYAGDQTEVSVFSVYNNMPVTAIGANAFKGNTTLTSITIPDSVTSIGDYAFQNCTGLTSVMIPDSVTTIGDNAFYYCMGLTSIVIPDSTTTIGARAFEDCTGLTSVTIGSGVTSIGSAAFSYCTRLTSIVIPDSTTTIGSYAFWNCTGLTSVTIGNSVASIGDYAFYNCTGLTSLTIPDSVTTIGDSAFHTCTGLTSVTIGSGVTSIGSSAFYNCTGLTSITIPNSVTSIGSYAFAYCTGLTSVMIGSGVTSIGSSAFKGCSSLISVTLPFVGGSKSATSASSSTLFGYIFGTSSYTGGMAVDQYYASSSYSTYYIPSSLKNVTITGGKILYGAFWNCKGLTSVTIGSGVTSIGSSAFNNCTGLTSVTIGSGVTSIGSSAFSGCSSLISITLPFVGGSADATSASSSTLFGYIFGTSSYTGGMAVDQYYASSSSTIYYIPDTLRNVTVTGGDILYGAFYNCTGLTSVKIGSGVTTISDYAFYGCNALTTINYNATECADLSSSNFVFSYAGQSGNGITVTIGANVTKIPASLFHPYGNSSYSPKIVSVVFAENSQCTSIGTYAFYGCTGLTGALTIPDSVTTIGKSAFYNCTRLTSVTIGDGVTTIGDWAFRGCTGLTSVTIGDGVTTIGDYAFYNCTGLTSIVIPDSTTTIGACAFSGCTGLTSIVIPDSVTTIGKSAFYNCTRLTSVTIGSGVTTIGDSAFSGCSGLVSITLPFVGGSADATSASSSTLFGYIFGTSSYTGGSDVRQYYASGSYSTYYIPSTLKNVTITGGKILYGAFENCTGLTSVTIGSGVTTIGDYAFYNCTGLTSIVIPDSVTSIGSQAFHTCTGLTSIVIPDSTTTIGASAFNNCTGLTSVTIGDGVTSIGNYAFYNCTGLTSVTIPNSVISIGSSALSGCSGLVSITLPFVGGSADATSVSSSTLFGYIFGTSSYTGGEAVKQYYTSGSYSTYYIPSKLKNVTITGDKIFYGAFYNCTGLTSVTIGSGVTTIGSYAFVYCTGLTSIVIPDSVISIGGSAFAYCSGLTGTLTIPDSVTAIGNYTFYKCTGLTSVTIGSSVTSIGRYAFQNCTGLTSVTIGSGVTTIGDWAFSGCTGLTSIVIPDSTTTIGASAFKDCTGLTSVEIGSGVTSIGDSAFYNCWRLTSMTIPDSVTSIGDSAFYGCTGLTSVTIGSGVTTIGDSAFYNCTGLTSIVIPDSTMTIGASAFYGCTGLTGALTIPDSVTSIGSQAFYGCTGLTSVTIGDGVTSIGNYAFYNCTGLTSIVIPDSTTTIGASTFENCTGLTSVTIGSGVTTIGDSAFQNCSGLTSVTIGNSVTTIGSSAFSGCSSLISITLPFVGGSADATSANSSTLFGYIFGTSSYTGGTAVDQYYASSSYSTYYIPSSLKNVTITGGKILYGAFYYCSGLTSVTIGDGVTSIGNYAFYYCTGLTSITIPDSVTSIGDYAFRGCKGLTSVTIGDGVTSIGNYAFYYCTGLTSVTIGSGVTTIGYYAFYNCTGLTSITIPNSVTSIGSYAFAYCSGLTGVTIGSGVTTIGSYAFENCTGLTSITIPNSVTSIGSYAFAYCTGLTSITIPNSVTSIGSYAFYNTAYYNDESNWENGVLYLGKYLIKAEETITGAYTVKSDTLVIAGGAFKDCTGLTSIEIPDSVTSIGYEAFDGCTGLTSVVIPDSVTTIGGSAFAYCSGLTGTLTIPDSVTSIGSYAFYGCTGLTRVTFKNTSGWFYCSLSTATSGTSISSSSLANSYTAATYLTSTYYSYYWKRS